MLRRLKTFYCLIMVKETGFGLLIQTMRERAEKANWCRGQEIEDVKYTVASDRDNPVISSGWDMVISSLEEIYEIAGCNDIKVVLMILPHTFQLLNPEMQKPQMILREHAKFNGVDVICCTIFFEELTSGDQKRLERYFLDLDHYTPRGAQACGKTNQPESYGKGLPGKGSAGLSKNMLKYRVIENI